jgi:hypothetical protein
LDSCELSLEFIFRLDEIERLFPRASATARFADFGVYNLSSLNFQTEIILMNFENVNFNAFSSPHTPKVMF